MFQLVTRSHWLQAIGTEGVKNLIDGYGPPQRIDRKTWQDEFVCDVLVFEDFAIECPEDTRWFDVLMQCGLTEYRENVEGAPTVHLGLS